MIETKSDILPIKTIYCVTLLALMLISPIANAIQVCTATDQLPNGSESAIKRALLFLSDVVNLNLSQYSVNNIVNTTRVRPDLGNLTENSASMDLMGPDIGTQPHIQFMCINNSPAFFKIRPGSAPLHYTNPSSSDLLKTVQSFLDRYQAFTADPNLSRMKELLINVTLKQPSETTTCKDITLTVKNDADDNSTLFTWRNTFNGVGYSSLQVRFTNGVFSYLFDDTSYFRVGDPTIDVSEQQAIAIGSEYAEKLNLGLPLAKSYFSAKLLAMGTDVDPLTLYPYYEVDLPVYGGGYVVVLLWAKDGKVIEWYDLPSGGGDLPPLTPSPTASSEPTQTPQQTPQPQTTITPTLTTNTPPPTKTPPPTQTPGLTQTPQPTPTSKTTEPTPTSESSTSLQPEAEKQPSQDNSLIWLILVTALIAVVVCLAFSVYMKKR